MRDAGPQRHVPAVVADGEAKTDGEVIFLYHIPDNLFRGSAEWPGRVLAIGKTADDQPGEPVEVAAPLKLSDHAIYIIEIFTHIFDEKDLSRHRNRGGCTGQVGQESQIAARYRRSYLATPVEGVWRAGIAEVLPFHGEAEGLHIRPFCPTIVECGGHRRKQGGDPESRFEMRVEQRDIAIADDPFRALKKTREVDVVDDPGKPIAAATAEHCFHIRVVQRLLQIGEPGLIGAGEIIIRIAAKGGADLYPVTPLLECVDTGLCPFQRHVAGGANDGDGITGAEVWRKADQDGLGWIG
jgi:hypothetical protein